MLSFLPVLLIGLTLGVQAEATAPQAPPYVGERMRWEIRYLGVMGGWAEAWAEAGDDGQVEFHATVDNASWYERLYTIHDVVQSTWVPGSGSRRYQTVFREGGFHQDQDMKLDPEGFSVWRHQRFDGVWREWTRSYPAHPNAEDPVSAIQVLRLLPGGTGPWRYPVFTGEETWTLVVSEGRPRTLSSEVLGEIAVRRLDLKTFHRGMLEQRGRFTIFVSDDDRRIPVLLLVGTNFGTIRADLVDYQPPAGGPIAAE